MSPRAFWISRRKSGGCGTFLPICAYCKKVRDDHEYWQQIESYLNERVGTRFSHGICPECYETHVMPAMERFRATDS